MELIAGVPVSVAIDIDYNIYNITFTKVVITLKD